MPKQHQKYTPEWEKEVKRLSLILDGGETDESKKKSKQLETLLKERSDLAKEQSDQQTQLKKLTIQRKQLLNIASYVREIEKEETRLNTNSTTHNPRMDNFLGTGSGTKWQTDGWTKKASDHFTPSSGTLNNLYKIKISNQEVETTEEQIINTIAYVVQALKNIDAVDFVAKYNAKISDSSKQNKVQTYLTNIKQQEIIVGNNTYDFAATYHKYDKSSNTWTAYTAPTFNYAEFFEFIELTHNQSFLADLDADKQKNVPFPSSWQISLKGETWKKEELVDYGINIDPSKTTLYKTGTDKQTIPVQSGIPGWLELAHTITYSDDNKTKLVSAFANSPTQQLLADLKTWTTDHGFITDGANFTLPESLPSLQELKDQLEMEKLGAAVKLVELKKSIEDKQGEIKAKENEVSAKQSVIDTLITEIFTKKREQLATYNISNGFKGNHKRSEIQLFHIQQLLLDIRYLENNGDATATSTVDAENTALTEIDNLLDQTSLYGRNNGDCYLVSMFENLAYKKDSPLDYQQAISRIKAGKYTSEGKEEDISPFGDLTKFKTHFENKEKLVKLSEWEIEAKQALEKALGEKDNAEEKLSDWQSKLKALDNSLDENLITETWKTKWGQIPKHQKITEVEKLLKEIIGSDNKVKPEFIEAVKKSDATLTDLKTFLQKEPKEIITYIALFTYNNLDDSATDEKNKKRTQLKRRITKKLSKNKESELSEVEIKDSLYKIRVGELVIDETKYYTADLKEITTQSPEQNEEKTGIIAWLNKNYWWPVWVPVVGIGILTAIFWKQISSWWGGSAEEGEEIVTNTNEESEEDVEK